MEPRILKFLQKTVHIAPLALFRVVFGGIMFFSIIRFMVKGWVYELYVEPSYFFTYYGFEWVKPLPEWAMYLLFGSLALSFLFQALGLIYRLASIFSFLAFTYIELIDKTNYLNHYYFVSIVCFLLIFVPAHRYFSLDVVRKPSIKRTHIPRYFVLLFQLQLAIVYFYAGLAKLNYDWLVNAMPLKLWLPSRSELPIIGSLLKQDWIAYLFSWSGAIYDLIIPFLLFNRSTRGFAYFLVIVFHLLTYALFQIGMFPFIMIGATLIFFHEGFHLKMIGEIRRLFGFHGKDIIQAHQPSLPVKPAIIVLTFFFAWQLLTPFRYALYPDNLYWTEEGYRFSWRVMLMEKAGYAIFHVEDVEGQKSWEVNNYDFLTPNQEKMMSTQPDMILQFAHYLGQHYQKTGIENVKITAEVYVTLNGKPSQLFLDPDVNLLSVNDGFSHKDWILPLETKTERK